MRTLCLLALIGATFSGCCSTHRAWNDGYGSCVPQRDDSYPTQHKSCLFKKSSGSRYSPCGSPCGDCGNACGSPCGSEFGDCSSCAGGMSYEGMPSSGCASCAQGQTADDGSTFSMPQNSTCPTCHQNHMSPTPSQSVAPPPPTPPAAPENPMPSAPEPTVAQMMQMSQAQMQPLRMLPTQAQPVQYQEWQPHQSPPPSLVPYNPPASLPAQQLQTVVQPVLWVPAQTQSPAPLIIPVR